MGDYKPRSGKDRRKLDKEATEAVSENLKKADLDYRSGQERREAYSDQRGTGMKTQRDIKLPGQVEWEKNLERHNREHERAKARMDKTEKADVLNKFIKKHQERHYISQDEIKQGLHPETEKALDAFKEKYGDTNLRGKITAIKAAKFGNKKILASPMFNNSLTRGRVALKLLKGGGILGISAALGAAAKVGLEAYKESKEKEENK